MYSGIWGVKFLKNFAGVCLPPPDDVKTIFDTQDVTLHHAVIAYVLGFTADV